MSKLRIFTVIFIVTFLLSNLIVPASADGTFGKISPKNGATDVPAGSAVLSWTPVVGHTGNDTITYRYCLQTKTKCPPGRWVNVGTATSVKLPVLTSTKTYYWWVRAYNSLNQVIAEADADVNGVGQAWTFKTMPLPGQFNKQSPASGSSQPINGVQLTWSNSINPAPDHYEYCLDSTNNSRCDNNYWVTAASGITLPTLTVNTRYYWQVRAVNGSGSTMADRGTWWSFTTTIVPNTFQKLMPANNATNQLVNDLGLSWMIDQNAVSYEYCISTASGTCSTNYWQNVGNVNWTSTGGLQYSTDYYWQVQAVYPDNSRHGADGDVWYKFTTQPAPPVAFGKSDPSNTATNVYTDVHFTWVPSAGAQYYEFCISTINTDITCGESPWDITNDPAYDVIGLDLATTYYWQVRAVNDTGTTESNAGTWWSFTTQTNPPAGFSKNSPATGSSATGTSLTLSWNPTSTAGVTYQVCYDTTNNNYCDDQNAWHPVSVGTSYDVSGLAYGTTYYWQVRAIGSQGMTYADGTQFAWWNFTTRLAPPRDFDKTSPTNGNSNQPVNPMLQWNASDLGVTYEYCVSTANNSCVSDQGWVTTTSTSVIPSGLAYGTTYYWQVRARNSQNTLTYANQGNWWSFTTYTVNPGVFEKISPADGATNQPLTVGLSWSDRGTAFHYEYCLTSHASLDCTTWTPVNGLTVQVPGLANDTTYRWQVRAVDGNNNQFLANDGAVWTFRTRPAPPTSSNAQFSTNEDTQLTGALQGSDQLTFALVGTSPEGLDLQNTGHFTYMPPLNFNGIVTFQFTVTDNINDPVGPYTVTITVNPVNDPPVLDHITVPATILSGDTLSFTATASDVDRPAEQLTFSITNQPAGVSFNSYTGVFSWTPIYTTTGTNTYSFTIVVSDGELTDHQDITITVQPVPPSSEDATFNRDEDQQVVASLHGAYTENWTFTRYGAAPAGTLDLQPNGHFTYTPPQDFFGTITFQFIVTNPINEHAGPYTVTMIFAPVNDAPVLDPISVPTTIRSTQTIRFTATATDVDLSSGEQLVFSITGLPAGATFDTTTGAFSWTPTWAKNGPNTYSFTITVSDGSLTDSQEFTVTVLPQMIYQPIVFH